MMIFWMTHPKHGRMPVYSIVQREENLKNGWKLEEEKPEPRKVGRPRNNTAEAVDG